MMSEVASGACVPDAACTVDNTLATQCWERTCCGPFREDAAVLSFAACYGPDLTLHAINAKVINVHLMT